MSNEMNSSCNDSKLDNTAIGDSTSPSHLENVKESHSLTFTSPLRNQLGLRARDNSDVTRGSMREQEEQLGTLRKENFNLKLRIYFLEEQKSGNATYDACCKQNIELKIEIETLKEEIDEKQKILEQAAQAIEAMEDNQTELKNKFDEKVEEFQNKIAYLEEELKLCNRCNGDCKELNIIPSSTSSIRSANSSFELQEDIFKKQNIISELENKILDLQSNLLKRDGMISDLRTKLDSQVVNSNKLELLLEQKGLDIAQLQMKVSSYKAQICDLQENLDIKNNEMKNIQQKSSSPQAGEPNLIANPVNDYSNLQQVMHLNELVAKRDAVIKKHEEAHRCACKVIQSFMQKNKEMNRELDKLKRKHVSSSPSAASETENSASGLSQNLSNFYKRENITNTESAHLSEDARHEREDELDLLESFYKKCLTRGNSASSVRKVISPASLKAIQSKIEPGDISLQHLELIEENKKLLQQIDELRTQLRNIPERENDDMLKELRKEHSQYKTECERLRIELESLKTTSDNINLDNIHWQDICLTLKDHLEELASFLKSLLRSDLNLSLSGDKFEKIKLAVDKSLDLSRSVSLSVSGIIKEGNSLAQLSSLTAYLDTSACSGVERLSGESAHDNILLDQAETISNLKNEILCLKKQLGNKHSNKTKFIRPDLDLSESEEWSEPDRNVSLSRIGLQNITNISPRRKSNPTKASQRSFSRKLALDEPHHDASVDSLIEKIKLLEGRIAESDKKLLERECDLLKADNEFKQEKIKFASELEGYKLEKVLTDSNLKETISKLSASELNITELNKKIQELSTELSESVEANKENELKISVYEEQINTIKSEMELKEADIRFTEENLQCVQCDMNELSNKYSKLKDENEKLTTTLQESIQVNEELCEQINSLRKEKNEFLENHQNETAKMQRDFKNDLEQNWISKINYNTKCSELEDALILLGEKENHLMHLQMDELKTISQLKSEHETEIGEMKEKEEKLLQKLVEQDSSYKTSLKDIDLLTLQMSEVTIEKSRISNEKTQLQKEIVSMKAQHDKILREMQLRISELEKENAESQNKLITLQTSNKHFIETSSGISNENSSDEGREAERLSVSSPDLGIDSDHGNISNNEYAHIERPLLKSLELTHSISNILDFEKPNEQSERMKYLEEENAALRKKVIKMRHTLQEALGQIVASNKKKRLVEKEIAEQLCKTHGVLRQVRSNIESNSNK